MDRSTWGYKLARLGPLLVAGVLSVMLATWILQDPVANVTTDWTAFDNAGDRLLAGDTVYRPFDFEDEPLPYLYPPFALWLTLPLTVSGFWGSFLISTLVPFVGYVAGLRLFGRAQPGEVDRTTAMIAAVASGACIGSTLIGQYSGLYVLAFGAGALLFRRDRRVLAGVVLAFLWLKPNIAIVVPVALLWARSWRTLRGFVAGSLGMVALSIPFGLDGWTGFVDNARNMAELQEQGVVPIEKMVTVLASVQTIFGLEQDVLLSIGIWLAIAAVLGTTVLTLWSTDMLEESPVRAFAALAIFAVAANPRLYFYDGALAVLGMFGLWMHARVSGGDLAKRWIPRLAWVVWLGAWGSIWSILNIAVGPAIAIALIVTAVDARSHASTATVSRGNFDESTRASPVDLAA